MATPIQHTSQFIPTDIGVLERNLADTQLRADSAYQGLLQADSQFANVLATNQDSKVKEGIIGDFRNKSGEILKKHGNDYAASAKELAREVVNAGNNPFWQLNAAKQRGIDMYNQMAVKGGADFIDGYNPANTPIYNEQAKQYTDPNDFTPVGYSHGKLSEGLDLDFEGFKTRLNETAMHAVAGMNDLRASETLRGIAAAEQPQLEADMYNQLKTSAPLADDRRLRDLAKNKSNSYIQGMTRDAMNIPREGGSGSPTRVKPTYEFPEYSNLAYTDESSVRNIDKTRTLLKKAIGKDAVTGKDKFNPGLLKTDPNLAAQLAQPVLNSAGEIADFLQYTGEEAFEVIKQFADLDDGNGTKHYAELWGRIPQLGTGEAKIRKATSLYDMLDKKYANLHTEIDKHPVKYKGKNYNGESGYVDLMLDVEEDNKVLQGTDLGIGHIIANKDLYSMHRDHFNDKGDADTYLNMENPKENLSASQVEKRLGTTPTNITIDSRGNIMVQVPTEKGDKKENFIINPQALPIQTSVDAKDMKSILDISKKYNLTDEAVKKINKTTYSIGTIDNTDLRQHFRINVDPTDRLSKTFEMYVPTELDENGNVSKGNWVPTTFAYAQAKLAKQVINSLKGEIREQ